MGFPTFGAAIRTLSAITLLCSVLLTSAAAQQTGNCEFGEAAADLNVNNVSARLYNGGWLFWAGSGNHYVVPKGGEAQSIFAANIWIGGLVDDTLHFSGDSYGPAFWPGPLDDEGNPPGNCSQYDRIYSVYREDVDALLATGEVSPNIADWPAHLGAPFVDKNADGIYDPGDGDYPEIIGDQTLWWVMNDLGNESRLADRSDGAVHPIGLELQVTAYAFKTANPLNNTTFYRYRLIYKGEEPLSDTYFGLWMDPDLGNGSDDFVGSDTLRSMAYVYNGDAFDEGVDGYGSTPPALGLDFVQGPLVPAPGEQALDPDGTVHIDSARLGMTTFLYYNSDSTPYGNPGRAWDYYNYLRGVWRDGRRMTYGGNGYGGTQPTNYMFTGDPVERAYWTEENTDGSGSRNTPSDRRFLTSTGPFYLQPGESQEIVLAIVWSRGRNRLQSVTKLKEDDVFVQGLFDLNFDHLDSLDAPTVTIDPLDQALSISWSNPETSSNFLNGYEERSPYVVDKDPPDGDLTYTFEGYRLYRYAHPHDQEGELIATIDVDNGITVVFDEVRDPETGFRERRVVAHGSDSGIQSHVVVDSLTNFQTYYFGIQAYAYNAHSRPKVVESEIRRFSGMPADPHDRGVTTPSAPGDVIPSIGVAGSGNADHVFATIANPGQLTGHTYEVRFRNTESGVAYDIIDVETSATKFDGGEYLALHGRPPFGESLITIDGAAFTVTSTEAAITGIHAVESPTGPNMPPDNVWHALSNDASYYLSATGTGRLDEVTEYIEWAAPRDFELRFTEAGGFGVYAFEDQTVATTPFELWDIGAGTPEDSADDVRMIPFLHSVDSTTRSAWGWAVGTDPYLSYPSSDAIYFADPEGEDGYERFAQHAASAGPGNPYPVEVDGSSVGYWADLHGAFVTPISRVVFGDYNDSGEPPPAGTVIRFTTTKPLAAGDIFAIDTGSYASVVSEDSAAAAIDNIGIVPNPYRGKSAYEVNSGADEVRFTNLQERSIVRVFSLSGDLVREMELSTTNNMWDLRNDEGHHIASGLYLVHIEIPGIGAKILKFGVVKKRLVD